MPGHVDDQVAGYATNYEVNAEKNFTFITVRCNGVFRAWLLSSVLKLIAA